MAAFLPYFLALNLLLLMVVAFYRGFLARQHRFQWNRAFLMLGMVAALTLPLLRWELVPISLPIRYPVDPPTTTATAPAFIPPSTPAPTTPAPNPAQPAIRPATVVHPTATWNAWDLGLGLYGLGVAMALAVLLWRNVRILRLIWLGQKTPQAGYTLVTTSADMGPASYFRFIFWNPEQLPDPQCSAVALAHERCHSRQLHSLDLLAVELVKAFCWFNPAIYLLRQDLRRTHEYLADQAALQVAGADGIRRLLLLRHLGPRHLAVANYFHSHIKARIHMLTSTTRKSTMHYLLIAPLAGLMVACSSFANPGNVLRDGGGGKDSTATQTKALEAPAPATLMIALDDVFARAKLPAGAVYDPSAGLVCLGENPQVMYIDSAYGGGDSASVDNMPKPLNRGRIIDLIGYPEEAKAKKITGTVTVKLLVDESGHVIRHIFLNESDPILRDAVTAHVRDLLFIPGKETIGSTNALDAGFTLGQATTKVAKWWVIVPFNFGTGGC
jgi:hypothetical protein